MNLNYHIHEVSIKCPYCDKEYRDDDYEVSRKIDDKVELECDCGKNFYAESRIVFNTYAACELNGQEHDLEETHIPDFFQCKNCEHCERNPAPTANSTPGLPSEEGYR